MSLTAYISSTGQKQERSRLQESASSCSDSRGGIICAQTLLLLLLLLLLPLLLPPRLGDLSGPGWDADAVPAAGTNLCSLHSEERHSGHVLCRLYACPDWELTPCHEMLAWPSPSLIRTCHCAMASCSSVSRLRFASGCPRGSSAAAHQRPMCRAGHGRPLGTAWVFTPPEASTTRVTPRAEYLAIESRSDFAPR